MGLERDIAAMRRRLNKIEPITDNQKKLFENYKEGKNIFAYGAAGTGKTFVALYLA